MTMTPNTFWDEKTTGSKVRLVHVGEHRVEIFRYSNGRYEMLDLADFNRDFVPHPFDAFGQKLSQRRFNQ